MKLLSQIFLSSILFVSNAGLLAQQEPVCPPTSMIRSFTLTRINNCGGSNPYLWCAFSNRFNYQNREWDLEVTFADQLDNTDIALKKAQEKFSTAEFLDAPLENDNPETRLSCLYSTSLIVLAYTPPMDSGVLKKLSFLR